MPHELCTVKYCEFDDAIKRCIEDGVGCSISRSDISAAFRNLGIKLQHWKFLLMTAKSPIDGKWYYFVDKCLPFGASISCSHFQAVSDAIAHVVKFYTHKKVTNYLDDFLFAAFLKMLCDEQVEKFIWVCQEINMPVNKEKTFWGTTTLTFLGLLVDTIRQLVCIPVEKVVRAKDLIEEILGKKKLTVHKLQKLCGFLNFLCRAVVPGRAFTHQLYSFTSGKTLKPHHHIAINQEMRSDLNMWLQFLNSPSVYARPFMDYSYFDAEDIDFYTDASRNFDLGFGGICETKWCWGQWDSYTRKVEPSIEYLELYALTVGFLLWGGKFANKRIHVFCDNMSVVHMVNNMSSSCKNCMVLIRIVVLESMHWNMRLFARHVRTEMNGPGDALSHLDFARFKCLTANKHMTDEPCSLPSQVWPLESIWIP